MLRFNKKGFTLIEIMVAATILSIGLLGIAGMMTTSVRGGAYGRRTSVAENLAIQKLEQFKNLSYANVKKMTENPVYGTSIINQCPGANGCPIGFFCVAAPVDTNCKAANKFKDPTCIERTVANELVSTRIADYGQITTSPEFRRVVVVRALNGCAVPPSDNLAAATVTVSWQNKQPTGQIQESSVQVSTFISK